MVTSPDPSWPTGSHRILVTSSPAVIGASDKVSFGPGMVGDRDADLLVEGGTQGGLLD
jgi:hypothetical protein